MPKIKSLTAFDVPIRLKREIRHASHVRTKNDTLIVRCEFCDGSVGWGEGLPRTYVTGESIDSVWRHVTQTEFTQLADLEFTNVADVIAGLDALELADLEPDDGITPRECFGNSVRCAVETAVLDAITRSFNIPFSAVVELIPEAEALIQRQDVAYYSGVVTSGNWLKQWRSAIRMKVFNFRQVKVKVGTVGIDDETCLARMRRILGSAVDLRLDANEAWSCDHVVSNMKPLERFNLTSLEQPVPHSEVTNLRDIRRDVNIPIMLDESLCCMEDAQRAIADESCDLFNLRLSKCGGIVACLRLAAMARQNNMGYQLGCQVGETGILSAAGRHFACNVANIRYIEGSFDRFLVKDSLTAEDLTFHYGGRGPRLDDPGLGITVNEASVRSLARRTHNLLKR